MKIRRNIRFMVPNVRTAHQNADETTWARADSENRIMELQNDRALDHTNFRPFVANQLRVLLSCVALALLRERGF